MSQPEPETLDSRILAGIRDDVLARFLRYVRVHTTSDEDSGTHPSSARQMDLARMLRAELEAMGALDVELDEHGYVYARLDPTPGARGPEIGFLAHLDTSPSVPGEGVIPLVRKGYDGGVLTYPDDPQLRLDPRDSPELLEFVGDDIVTASGTTLLGADDKAGVAEIMAAVAVLTSNPALPRPGIRICFTPDEEIGAGTAKIRVEKLGKLAYTLDGGLLGELETECFDARGVRVRFQGRNVHPGYAKEQMVNAGAIAARFFASLPEWQSPERATGREGFYHLTKITGDETRAEIAFIVRDFDADVNDARVALLESQAAYFRTRYPGLGVEVEAREQYRNMREVLDRHPEVVEAARHAMEAAGIRIHPRAIRGGTDGSRLCFLGLPTPNLFAGGLLFHSTREWVPVSALVKATEVIVRLASLWKDRGYSATRVTTAAKP